MSATQTVFGSALMISLGALALDLVTPDVPPIVVHDLTYSDGIIHQERTVTTDQEVFYATWSAQVVDAATGDIVCSGGRSWNYKPGYLVADLSLADWTGDETCTPDAIGPGSFYPVASWFWGDDQTSHRGEVFTIQEVAE